MRNDGPDGLKLLIIGDEMLEVPGPAAGRAPAPAAQARALPRLRAGRPRWSSSTGWPASSSFRRSTKASACRRSRRWRAARRSSPRTSRRCRRWPATRPCWSIPTTSASIADGLRRAVTDEAARERPDRTGPGAGAGVLLGARGRRHAGRLRRGRGSRVDASGPRPRLADRHARRREGPRRLCEAVSGRRPLHAAARARRRSRPAIERRPHPHVVHPAPAPAPPRATGTTCRSFRLPSSTSTSTASTSSSARSHCVAKSVVVPRAGPHLCYCLLPMRYAWDQFDAYFGPAAGRPRVASAVLRPVMARLARWDAATASAPPLSRYLSVCCADGSRRYYNRESTVVYPPVDTDFFTPGCRGARARHFLVVSALVPYKRLDVAIDACPPRGRAARHRRRRTGARRARSACRRGPGVALLGRLTDEAVRELYRARRGRAAAWRRGLRHRAGRSAGLRASGGGPGPRRRPRNRHRRRDRRARARRLRDAWADALQPRRQPAVRLGAAHPRARRAVRHATASWPSFRPRGGRGARRRAARDTAVVRRYNRLLVAFYVADRRAPRRRRRSSSPICSASRPASFRSPRASRRSTSTSTSCRSWPSSCRSPSTCRASTGCGAAASRVDDFFAVLVGSILAVVLGVVSTLYFQAYYVPDDLKSRGAYEVSQLVWAHLPGAERRPHLRVARGRARSARTALARGHRPQARS